MSLLLVVADVIGLGVRKFASALALGAFAIFGVIVLAVIFYARFWRALWRVGAKRD